MGFFDDTLLIGGGLAFAEHEHHKHQMQRQMLQQQQQGVGFGYSNNPYNGQQQSRSISPAYGQSSGYYQGGQDMITVPRSEWERLQREATEGRQMMQRYIEKMEDLEKERKQLRAQNA